jgi:fructokinase
VGSGPGDIVTTRFPTTTPEETVGTAVGWLKGQSGGRLSAVGIGSFGPVDLKSGKITSTPKMAWRNYDLAGAVRRALGVPVVFDTDVNAAVAGEMRWGAARGVADCLYITIGTGIGGGATSQGRVMHGLTHPEMGHVRIPHDWSADPFRGACPYHGDCLEGLASGPAIEARWGARGETLPEEHGAWPLQARYVALGIANFICTLSPELIVLGGGVMKQARLYAMIQQEVRGLLGGYVERLPEVVPPGLGDLSGVLGAIAMASGTRDFSRVAFGRNERD